MLSGEDAPTSLIARVAVASPTDAPPPEPPLEPIRSRLEREGLPVPRRYGGDETLGIELLEDLGQTSLEAAAHSVSPARRRALYRAACRLIARLQRVAPERGVEAFERRLDALLFAHKTQIFQRFGLPWLLGRAPSEAECEVAARAFACVEREALAAPARLSHRDYKAANLLLPDPSRDDRLVMIDLQGALMAPPEYDAVCLLRDSHVELPEAEIRDHVSALRAELPEPPDAETFERRMVLLTLTRVGKDASHYLRASSEQADDRYLAFLPLAARNLRRAAARAAEWDGAGDLARLAELVPARELTSETTCGP